LNHDMVEELKKLTSKDTMAKELTFIIKEVVGGVMSSKYFAPISNTKSFP
jgi:hypothetical protein